MSRALLLFILSLSSFTCFAQKQNNNWCFGTDAGIDFNTTPPSSLATAHAGGENCASISDRKTGQLLFYTNGLRVWDRTHNVMPNGYGVGNDSTGSSAQGSVIVPWPKEPNKYVLFLCDAREQNTTSIRYSVIDMTLNGGLGDVVAGQKNIYIDNGFTELLTTVTECDRTYIFALKRNTGILHAYSVIPSGVNTTPVISAAGYTAFSTGLATAKASHDHKKFAIANYSSGTRSYLTLYDLDSKTGKISNPVLVDSINGSQFYGAEFSPDDTKLYTCALVSAIIYQYDIASGVTATMSASRTLLASGGTRGAPQMGPDSSIYISRFLSNDIDRIPNPNALKPALIYTNNAITLIASHGGITFPQLVVYPPGSDNENVNIGADTTICSGDMLQLRNTAATVPAATYTWSNGTSASTMSISNAGKYWLTLVTSDGCTQVDTITVSLKPKPDVDLGKDTAFCRGGDVTLKANPQASGSTFLWNTGSTDSTLKVNEVGSYTLSVTTAGCTGADAVKVEVQDKPAIDLGDSRELCYGEIVNLPLSQSTARPFTLTWQDGSNASIYEASVTGRYTATLTNTCGTVTDEVQLDFRNCSVWFPSAFSPNGDGRNDRAYIMGDINNISAYTLMIYDRWGAEVFTTRDVTAAWDGRYKTIPANPGTYYYYITGSYQHKPLVMKGDITLVR